MYIMPWYFKGMTDSKSFVIVKGHNLQSYRVFEPILESFLSIVRALFMELHGRVKCHMNKNFVGYQNMCDLKGQTANKVYRPL